MKDCTLPADVPPVVSDMMPYFTTAGLTAPALEFLSPIKGPSLEQITVAVGSGIATADDGTAQYDQDVQKQAKQLGLPNWEPSPERKASPRPILSGGALPEQSMPRRSPYPYWFVLPAAVVSVTLFLVPTVATLRFSLTRWDLFTTT